MMHFGFIKNYLDALLYLVFTAKIEKQTLVVEYCKRNFPLWKYEYPLRNIIKIEIDFMKFTLL